MLAPVHSASYHFNNRKVDREIFKEQRRKSMIERKGSVQSSTREMRRDKEQRRGIRRE